MRASQRSLDVQQYRLAACEVVPEVVGEISHQWREREHWPISQH